MAEVEDRGGFTDVYAYAPNSFSEYQRFLESLVDMLEGAHTGDFSKNILSRITTINFHCYADDTHL